MKIAVINEFSAMSKNNAVVSAIEKQGRDVLNLGMSDNYNDIDLTYIHTGFMAGAVLNLGLADLVVGGCGTGQGFLISANQYPNVYCGLLLDPADAFVFSQINAGNCVSLALNKGYGWAGELNLDYMFEKFFQKEPGRGYPEERAAIQAQSRGLLKGVNEAAHKSFDDILRVIDKDIVKTALSHRPFLEAVKGLGHKGFDSRIEEFGL